MHALEDCVGAWNIDELAASESHAAPNCHKSTCYLLGFLGNQMLDPRASIFLFHIMFASSSQALTRKFFMANYSVGHLYHDISGPRCAHHNVYYKVSVVYAGVRLGNLFHCSIAHATIVRKLVCDATITLLHMAVSYLFGW